MKSMNIIIQDRWITSSMSKYGSLYMEPVSFASRDLTHIPKFDFGSTEQNWKMIRGVLDGNVDLCKLKTAQEQQLYNQQKKQQ